MAPVDFTAAFGVVLASVLALNVSTAESPADVERDARDSDSSEKVPADFAARKRFAPTWQCVPKYQLDPAEAERGVPAAPYANVWNALWQNELDLTESQKESLAVLRAEVEAAARKHSEEFAQLSKEERDAEVKSWGGNTAPWRRSLDQRVRLGIESALTREQLQTLKHHAAPAFIVGLMYDAEVRRRIAFSPGQEHQFRQVIREKVARSQEQELIRADRIWNLLSPEQQAAMPDVVRRQGPTSAVLSIAYHVRFDRGAMAQAYPLLWEEPVRERLDLSREQNVRLRAATADAAEEARQSRDERLRPEAYAENRTRFEAILTPAQLKLLKQIDFRRAVDLALHYPDKRKSIGMTDEQVSGLRRIDRDTHDKLYRIDRELLEKAGEILTPLQREQLNVEIEQRYQG